VGKPEVIETARLILRKPVLADAEPIFRRYSSDPEVTRYMSFPRHRRIDETIAFLAYSDAEWDRWPAGPYVILSRDDGTLLGATGFGFEAPPVAATGYVLARDAWGRGIATEALQGIVATAPSLGLKRLYALCHPSNAPSLRVLEKCGFALDGGARRRDIFPNLDPENAVPVLTYARNFNG
jgi:RimJ/RimL family protein N-acetyltransferase